MPLVYNEPCLFSIRIIITRLRFFCIRVIITCLQKITHTSDFFTVNVLDLEWKIYRELCTVNEK